MKAWVDYIRRVDGDNHGWRKTFHYGDWLALDNSTGSADDVIGATDAEFIASVYYAASARLVAKAAAVLGYEKEWGEYDALADEQFETVRHEYYSGTGRCCIKTQTALLLTLKYHLSVNEELIKEQLVNLLRQNGNKLNTGFVGTPILCNVLSDNDLNELAYKLLLNEDYPGWLHEVNLGATTVWERWNSVLDDGKISGTGMNSLNHYAYGSVVEWVFRHAAGLNFDESRAGCRLALMKPVIDTRLGRLNAVYDSPAGKYESGWEIIDANHVKVTAKIPFGCAARLTLPYGGERLLEAGDFSEVYETNQSLTKVYNTNLPLQELKDNPATWKKLSAAFPLGAFPAQCMVMSLRELASVSGGAIKTEDLDNLDKMLAQL
jgi:alpha-L-rhamnosidase